MLPIADNRYKGYTLTFRVLECSRSFDLERLLKRLTDLFKVILALVLACKELI